jgi:hypothetical protein
MQHVRIATYKQTAGTFEELSRMIQAPGGLADVFRATPGFVAYTFADLGDGTNCSISVWGSAESADAATAAARTVPSGTEGASRRAGVGDRERCAVQAEPRRLTGSASCACSKVEQELAPPDGCPGTRGIADDTLVWYARGSPGSPPEPGGGRVSLSGPAEVRRCARHPACSA